MTAKREDIFAAIETRLTALSGVQEVQRMASGDPAQFPALFIEDGGQQLVDGEPQQSRYTIDVTIEGFVEGGDGSEAHAALNTLYADTVRALLNDSIADALRDATVREGPLRVQTAQLGDRRRMGFQIDFEIEFAAARNDPAV